MLNTPGRIVTALALACLAGCGGEKEDLDAGIDIGADVPGEVAGEVPGDLPGDAPTEAQDQAPDFQQEIPASERSLAIEELPESAKSGSLLTLTVRARDDANQSIQGATINALVTRGGGQLPVATATTGVDGLATFQWTLGPAPVRQTVSLDWNGVLATATLDGVLDTPLAPAVFGNVAGFLASQAIEGSTEDLAFSPDGTRMILGVPGGLLEVDSKGDVTTMALTGDTVGWPLGIAYDTDANLWVADANGKAARRIDPAGNVTTVQIGTPAIELKYPNDLTTAAGGLIVMADSCLGKVLVFRADGTLVSEAGFDAASEGGANGVAVDPSGTALWVTTENTALLCMDGSDMSARNGGLYKFALGSDGTLGERTDVAPGFASYADGVTFDAEGNLYMMVDQVDTSLGLVESAVWILPAGGGELRRFLSTTDKAMANAAFGPTAFGEQKLYMALIAIPVLVDPEQRGVVAIDVGIKGHPLIPK
jgi:sugar lactone lactonase YvrE